MPAMMETIEHVRHDMWENPLKQHAAEQNTPCHHVTILNRIFSFKWIIRTHSAEIIKDAYYEIHFTLIEKPPASKATQCIDCIQFVWIDLGNFSGFFSLFHWSWIFMIYTKILFVVGNFIHFYWSFYWLEVFIASYTQRLIANWPMTRHLKCWLTQIVPMLLAPNVFSMIFWGQYHEFLSSK